MEVVRHAAKTGSAVVPLGGGTHIQTGNTLRAERWMALYTREMAGIVEYSPPDMVVTARAGITLAELGYTLAEQRQFLPIDHPAPHQATLGGMVATNAQGLYRFAYGQPRDMLLGLRIVLGTGEVIKAGGRVVKNVAGYDLCKLFAGSWGTLGVIVECTFRTCPMPERQQRMAFRAASLRRAIESALRLYQERSDPLYALVCSHPAPRVYVGVSGGEEAVAWKGARISELLLAEGLEPEAPNEDPLREAENMLASHGSARGRYTVRPSELANLADALAHRGAALAAHGQTGLLDFALDTHTPQDAEAVAALAPSGAHLAWTSLPAVLREVVDAWGPVRADFPLMKAVKSALDPHGVFSPGRFVGRL